MFKDIVAFFVLFLCIASYNGRHTKNRYKKSSLHHSLKKKSPVTENGFKKSNTFESSRMVISDDTDDVTNDVRTTHNNLITSAVNEKTEIKKIRKRNRTMTYQKLSPLSEFKTCTDAACNTPDVEKVPVTDTLEWAILRKTDTASKRKINEKAKIVDENDSGSGGKTQTDDVPKETMKKESEEEKVSSSTNQTFTNEPSNHTQHNSTKGIYSKLLKSRKLKYSANNQSTNKFNDPESVLTNPSGDHSQINLIPHNKKVEATKSDDAKNNKTLHYEKTPLKVEDNVVKTTCLNKSCQVITQTDNLQDEIGGAKVNDMKVIHYTNHSTDNQKVGVLLYGEQTANNREKTGEQTAVDVEKQKQETKDNEKKAIMKAIQIENKQSSLHSTPENQTNLSTESSEKNSETTEAINNLNENQEENNAEELPNENSDNTKIWKAAEKPIASIMQKLTTAIENESNGKNDTQAIQGENENADNAMNAPEKVPTAKQSFDNKENMEEEKNSTKSVNEEDAIKEEKNTTKSVNEEDAIKEEKNTTKSLNEGDEIKEEKNTTKEVTNDDKSFKQTVLEQSKSDDEEEKDSKNSCSDATCSALRHKTYFGKVIPDRFSNGVDEETKTDSSDTKTNGETGSDISPDTETPQYEVKGQLKSQCTNSTCTAAAAEKVGEHLAIESLLKQENKTNINGGDIVKASDTKLNQTDIKPNTTNQLSQFKTSESTEKNETVTLKDSDDNIKLSINNNSNSNLKQPEKTTSNNNETTADMEKETECTDAACSALFENKNETSSDEKKDMDSDAIEATNILEKDEDAVSSKSNENNKESSHAEFKDSKDNGIATAISTEKQKESPNVDSDEVIHGKNETNSTCTDEACSAVTTIVGKEREKNEDVDLMKQSDQSATNNTIVSAAMTKHIHPDDSDDVMYDNGTAEFLSEVLPKSNFQLQQNDTLKITANTTLPIASHAEKKEKCIGSACHTAETTAKEKLKNGNKKDITPSYHHKKIRKFRKTVAVKTIDD